MIILALLTYFLLFAVSVILTKLYLNFARAHSLLDLPNERSSHQVATPRGGGSVFIGLWLLVGGIFVFATELDPRIFFLLLSGTFLVALVGFLDDKFSLSPVYRGGIHFLAALILLLAVGGIDQIHLGFTTVDLIGGWKWAISIIVLLLTVWSINLFNFMDGTDGIAVVEAIFVFGMGGFMLWMSGGQMMALLAWGLIATIAGFLVWNWPPAKVFMGDVGSATLGFLVLAFAIVGQQLYGVSIFLWLILYSAFLTDTLITLIRRILAKELWYQAHRKHAYQRLYQFGWSHRKILVVMILNNLILVCWGLIGYYFEQSQLWMLAIAWIQCIAGYLAVERLRPMYSLK